MLNTTDWTIILIAAAAAIAALLLLRPHTRNRDVERLRILRNQAEEEQRQSKEWLSTLELSAQHSQRLAAQIQTQANDIDLHHATCESNATQTHELLEHAYEAENELRQVASSLGGRLHHVQNYWDEQLDDTVDSVQQIKERLKEGLLLVGESLVRLQEQENTAQKLTQQLMQHYQEQERDQEHNAQLSSELKQQLASLLTESNQSLEQMRSHQAQANTMSKRFAEEMHSMEQQASEHFTQLYQSTEQARQEMSASLEEARHHLETLRRREEQSSAMSQRIRQQAVKVESLNLEQLAKTIESTRSLCGELEHTMAHTRQVLGGFDHTMQHIGESLQHAEALNQQVLPDDREEPVLVAPMRVVRL